MFLKLSCSVEVKEFIFAGTGNDLGPEGEETCGGSGVGRNFADRTAEIRDLSFCDNFVFHDCKDIFTRKAEAFFLRNSKVYLPERISLIISTGNCNGFSVFLCI